MKPYHNVKVGGKTYSEHKLVWERANGVMWPNTVPPLLAAAVATVAAGHSVAERAA